MVIRYLNSGEEFEASLKAQARIWQNMTWDEQVEAKQKEAEEARFQRSYGVDFDGLANSDFKTNTEGTGWRSRRGLVGRVAQLLSHDTPYTFLSWAIYGWPVAFLTHREDYNMAAFEMGSRKVKFAIELDEDNAYYGLYIERNAAEMDKTWDWTRLIPALQKEPQLQKVISDAESEYRLRFLGRMSSGTEHFHFADGLTRGAHCLWEETDPSTIPVSERLRLVNEIPADHWAELYFIATTPKADALRARVDLAHKIAKVMCALLPLYSVAIRE
jgi:hypothetical protein